MSLVMISETRCWTGAELMSLNGEKFRGIPDKLIRCSVTHNHGWASVEAARKHWRDTKHNEVSPGVWRSENKNDDTYQLVWFEEAK